MVFDRVLFDIHMIRAVPVDKCIICKYLKTSEINNSQKSHQNEKRTDKIDA